MSIPMDDLNKGSKDYSIGGDFANNLRKQFEQAAKKGAVYYGNAPLTPNYSVPGSASSNIQPTYNIGSSGNNSIYFILIVGMLAAVLIFKR